MKIVNLETQDSIISNYMAELRDCHAQVDAYDPWVDAAQCQAECGIKPIGQPEPGHYDAVLIAVAHRQFRELGADGIRALLKPGGIVFDVKYLLPREAAEARL